MAGSITTMSPAQAGIPVIDGKPGAEHHDGHRVGGADAQAN
jgi:hypothetical protein